MFRTIAKTILTMTLGQFQDDEHFVVSVAVAGMVAVSAYYLYNVVAPLTGWF